MKLKDDHVKRPLYITEDNHIFLETFNSLYRIAYEFLISISDPLNRPQFIHEYKLTKFSLYTAMVLQYDPEDILRVL